MAVGLYLAIDIELIRCFLWNDEKFVWLYARNQDKFAIFTWKDLRDRLLILVEF